MSTTNSYAENYYGYAGSCNDGIYVFDFMDLKVSEYLQHRVIGSKWQYSLKNRTLKKKSQDSYILWHETDDPAVLELTSDTLRIHGKSINNGYMFYYERCDKTMALDIINKAKSYASQSPNNKIQVTPRNGAPD